jgi:hypothetical protein
MDESLLPEACTCSAILYIPKYKSKDETEKKLKLAVSEGIRSFGNY